MTNLKIIEKLLDEGLVRKNISSYARAVYAEYIELIVPGDSTETKFSIYFTPDGKIISQKPSFTVPKSKINSMGDIPQWKLEKEENDSLRKKCREYNTKIIGLEEKLNRYEKNRYSPT